MDLVNIIEIPHGWAERCLASKHLPFRIFGSMLSHKVSLIAFLAITGLAWWCTSKYDFNLCEWLKKGAGLKFIWLCATAALCMLIWNIAETISRKVYYNSGNEAGITRCEAFKLAGILFFVVMVFLFFGTGTDNKDSLLSLGIVGTVLGLIFQDSIKGAVAFFHMRRHRMLQIGDWIIVDKYGIDGKIRSISMTTVTVENWDTTTSSVPLGGLLSEQVQNLQKMNEGHTNGRRMLRSFIIDTGWIHPLAAKEISVIESKIKDKDKQYHSFVRETLKEGTPNMSAFREYVECYLRGNKDISDKPRLIVRWMEQTGEGIPLQLYTFVTEKTALEDFEKVQSRITEHIIDSMGWFGLRLYQSPSGYDASNGNIFMTDKEAKYGKD